MIARILIAEDDANILSLLKDFLTELHLEVLEATDGAQAFAMAERSNPHLIITDVVMPGLYGTTAARRLQDYWRTREVPIIIMSGSVESSIIGDLLTHPKVRFLKKPLDLALLARTIRELLPDGGFRPW
ncbi:MAG: response regulator [Elusimicrobia bacterium]|nr:response regulator [Elusimicrobiota bacterium]